MGAVSLFPLGLTFLLAVLPVTARSEPCDKALLPSSPADRTSRLMEVDDLIQLRDIGPPDPTNVAADILSVSPDGNHVALQVRKADLASNSYCFGIVVVAVDGSEPPVLLDTGGEYIFLTRQVLGFPAFTPSGAPITVIPKWSPDGKSLAYLRRDDGVTQAWTVRLDGRPAKAATHFTFDVEDVAWSVDGLRLVVSGRPGLRAARDRIAEEGQQGFLYDDRFVPANGNQPLPRGSVEPEVFSVGLARRDVRPATPAESDRVSDVGAVLPAPSASLVTPGPSRRLAWVAPSDPANTRSAKALYVRDADGTQRKVVLPVSSVITGLWWVDGGSDLVFATLEGRGYGWNASKQGFYKWSREATEPARILLSDDVFIGCQPDGRQLICGHEAPTQPREVVGVDVSTGTVRSIWDANPEIRSLTFGDVKRLYWKNDFGIETFGDLVLPPSHRAGQTHPLIVVQYRSRGFLRGGTGDEYPIQLFAARGFAVLSFNHPASLANFPSAGGAKDSASGAKDWAERKNIQSALERGVQTAITTGAVDGNHVGITGLSDGATTAQFAMLNSSLFSAAAISTCCDDPAVTSFLGGPVLARSFAESGYPTVSRPDFSFWRNYSFAQTDRTTLPPILIQASDTEYLGALEAYQALKERGSPLEMYVFPGEFHVKWQPVHRRAAYLRSIDWFAFWLMRMEDADPRKADQYARWRGLRGAPDRNAPD